MDIIQKRLRVLLFLAVGCLVLNDVARLVCPDLFQPVCFLLAGDQGQEEENTPAPASNLLEEEAKHHQHHQLPEALVLPDDESSYLKTHRIQDDDILVLAFITIFSPPPNRA
ncbi:MAG: hypothetical protein IPM98_06935 [Lewinellaceae bacterium]|nr:hypothetical protein [Lewinellaceae bacterium]